MNSFFLIDNGKNNPLKIQIIIQSVKVELFSELFVSILICKYTTLYCSYYLVIAFLV